MHYECRASECILTSYICDGIVDCLNGSDEVNCSGSHDALQTNVLVHKCEDLYYECHPGHCIPLTQLCDDQFDCSDGLDELRCPKSKNDGYLLLSYTTTVSIKVCSFLDKELNIIIIIMLVCRVMQSMQLN